MFKCLALAASAAFVMSSSVSAHSIPIGREGPLAAIVRPVPGAKACFKHAYDAAHLRRHPDQKVTSMVFRLRYYKHPGDKQDPQGQRFYYFDLGARVKGRPRFLRAAGECNPDGTGIRCRVDCDGGGVNIRFDPSNDTLLVGFNKLIPRLRMTESCADDERAPLYELEPGQDDRSFQLTRADSAMCRVFGPE
jgi:hypothetical protein